MHLILRSCRPQGIAPHVRSFVAAAQPAHRFKLYNRSQKTCMAAVSDKIVIITGPTAVGKSKLGVALAKHLDGEVISADSVQVYNKLDIGSDKITVEDRQGVPHHLIDILEPTKEFSAGDFYHAARAAAAEIISRGKVPIVVGGTGFYLRWFIFGKASTPASNPETGEKVQQLVQQAWQQAEASQGSAPDEAQRWQLAVDLVGQLGDQETAERVRPERNNYYRLQRVLQILVQNGGVPLSQQDIDTSKTLDYDFRCFLLHRPRVELFNRISQRVEEMVAGGLLQEAAMLLKLGIQSNSNTASKAIGYRQAMDFLQAAHAKGGASRQDLLQLIADICTKSRQLVKNQHTWFRDDDMFAWQDVSSRSQDDVLQHLLAQLQQPGHTGGCGDSGRLDKDGQRASKTYQLKLVMYNDEARVQATLKEVQQILQQL